MATKPLINIDSREILSPPYLLHPTTLAIIGSNLLPLLGVFFWGWDVFLLLNLHWMETAIIGFWMILGMAVAHPDGVDPEAPKDHVTAQRINAFAWLIVHAGGFMAFHMLILWVVFAGDWATRVHGVASYIDQIVLRSGLWIPLLAMVLSRGLSFLFHDLYPDLLQRLLGIVSARPLHLAQARSNPAWVLIGFYGRIIVMQFALLAGAGALRMFGTVTPFVLLVAAKTCFDVYTHILIDMGLLAKSGFSLDPAAVAAAIRERGKA